eukprot:scaffold80831_cov72-Phaeocystis_antarctica.AAC.1
MDFPVNSRTQSDIKPEATFKSRHICSPLYFTRSVELPPHCHACAASTAPKATSGESGWPKSSE